MIAGGAGSAEIAALIEMLAERFGGGVALAEPATSKGEGFDSDVHLVRQRVEGRVAGLPFVAYTQ